MNTRPIILTFLVVCISCGINGCAKDLVTGKTTMNWYGVDADVKIGQDVLNQQIGALKKKHKNVDAPKDKEELNRLRGIVARIGPVTHYPQFPYEVHLADVEVVNAWCAPGGKMMVFTGLWNPEKGFVEKDNDAELAAVLSHEIAHANARHVTEMVSRGQTLSIITTAAMVGVGAGAGSQAANAFGQVASLGFNIYFPTYSRENEAEADRIGLIYMAKAGYDPRVAVTLWERAAKKKGDNTSIFASHPSSGARAEALKEMLPEALPYYEESPWKYHQKTRSKVKGARSKNK